MGRTQQLRGLGFDPGKVNCAYAVWHHDHVEETDVIEGIDDVVRLPEFTSQVARIIKWFSPDVVGIERYQLRRGTGFVGNMELVNIMIGVVCGLCSRKKIPVHLVLAATHKKWAGDHHGAEQVKGKLNMQTCPDLRHLKTEHEADAANVIRYVMSRL
jgi:Holliday junction resolvasome RuvABC endonuclease subunit